MSWREVKLGDVCEFAYGKSLRADDRSGTGFPVYGSNGIVGYHDTALTSGETIIVGRKGSFGEVHFSPQPCTPIDTTYYITAAQTKAYLPWLTRQLRCLKLTSLNRAAAVPGLNREDAYRLTLLLPPLAEQKRIAAILDAADALRAKRREALAQLDNLLQATFLDMFGDPVTNPKRWQKLPLNKVGEFISGGTPSKTRNDYWAGTIPWVSPKDMKVAYINDAQDHVSDAAFKETTLKLLHPGHLLIVVRGMILAHSFPAAINRVPIAINQDMKAIMPLKSFDAQFLLECVRRLKREILANISTAAHGTKRFDLKGMQEVGVIKPPLDLQRRFAVVMNVIERQQASHCAYLTELDNLFASLQSRAFRGEL